MEKVRQRMDNVDEGGRAFFRDFPLERSSPRKDRRRLRSQSVHRPSGEQARNGWLRGFGERVRFFREGEFSMNKILRTIGTVLLFLLLFAATAFGGEERAKYIFLFIGDGMGEGADRGRRAVQRRVRERGPLALRGLAVRGKISTRSANAAVTGLRCGGGRRWLRGFKTNNGVLGMDPSVGEKAAHRRGSRPRPGDEGRRGHIRLFERRPLRRPSTPRVPPGPTSTRSASRWSRAASTTSRGAASTGARGGRAT